MEETYVAILFVKIFSIRNAYAFMPYSCAEVSKSESSLYVNYEGEKCYSIEKSHIMIDESLGLYYGFLVSLKELQEKYGEKSEKELLELYMKDFNGNMYFGLDRETGKLEIVSLSLEPIINVSDNPNELEEIRQFVITPIKNIEENKGGNL